MADLTKLLLAWEGGDETALDHLATQAYDELRRLAHLYLCTEGPEQTLETRDLVNEAFLRLFDQRRVGWQNRDQFFRLCARLMRRIVVDRARRRRAAKRGGAWRRVATGEIGGPGRGPSTDVLALHQALTRLGQHDPRQVEVVELRFFVGLTIDETSRALGRSPMTVKREWALAKAWLARALAVEPVYAS